MSQTCKNGNMVDHLTPAERSRNMARIRSKNTEPEMCIRKGLHALGYRYILHSAKIPGKPDIVLPKYRAVIFIHGCYWHGHDCGQAKLPKSNGSYWLPKIARNQERDARNLAAVEAAGWRHLVIWECAFRRKGEIGLEETVREAAEWVTNGDNSAEIQQK